MKEQLLNILDEYLEKINLDLLFDSVYLNGILDISMLISAIEAVYYKKLILRGENNSELLSYLSLLRCTEEKPSMFSYLFIIYRLDKLMKGKPDSNDNLNNLYM